MKYAAVQYILDLKILKNGGIFLLSSPMFFSCDTRFHIFAIESGIREWSASGFQHIAYVNLQRLP